MIWDVAYVVGSAVGSGGAARPGAEAIVSRPRLVGRLGASARVTLVSAPPGSGKTVLLRSWISQAGAANCAAWVPVGRAEHDLQRFWLSVLAAPCWPASRRRSAFLLTFSRPQRLDRAECQHSANAARAVCPRESRHVESAQDTGQLQADIVAPGDFMVQIRRPAIDEDRQQEQPRNR